MPGALTLSLALSLLAAASAAITSPISLTFRGRSWSVKTGGPLDPGANTWLPSLAAVDPATGVLSLSVAPVSSTTCGGPWASSEVWLNAPLGYGTYVFQMTFPLSVRALRARASCPSLPLRPAPSESPVTAGT